MIFNAVIHINNEQPLVADLFDMPTVTDLTLRCTNLRQLNGKRPIFADDMHSVFFFPYLHIRFIEIPPTSLGAGDDRPVAVAVSSRSEGYRDDGAVAAEVDLEIDEDFLRRIREV